MEGNGATGWLGCLLRVRSIGQSMNPTDELRAKWGYEPSVADGPHESYALGNAGEG
jgi:hypothetical protein